ncbi:MAG TPA: hypothetical protein VK737_03330 [Opitutales bacterium]|jgi:hypothetical protein|nr:hypothetical protein [Opitutales bacterium]
MFISPTSDQAREQPSYSDVPGIEAVAIQRMEQSFTNEGIHNLANGAGSIEEINYLDTTNLPMDGSGLVLALKHKLELDINFISGNTTVKRWNVTTRTIDAWDLPRLLARKFLQLQSKAANSSLSAEEMSQYNTILEEVDWNQYAIDCARPHYVEGTVVQKSPLRIRWADDTSQDLPWTMAKEFFLLESGDKFSAHVKLGRDNTVLAVRHVNLIA